MKFKFCNYCTKETWHNPLKKKTGTEQEYRCVLCGRPMRTGGNAKNFGILVGLKIMFLGPGQAIR